MIKRMMIFMITVAVVFVIFSCEKTKVEPVDNENPVISIVISPDSLNYPLGSEILIAAEVTGISVVDSVGFYVDDIPIYFDDNEPFFFVWNIGEFRSCRDTTALILKVTAFYGNEESVEEFIEIDAKDAIGSAPSIPSNPIPANNALAVSVNTRLAWESTDPDSHQLFFDVFLGTHASPDSLLLVSEKQDTTSFNFSGSFDFDTTYYWRVKAFDEYNYTGVSDIWQFTTDTLYTTFEWSDIPAGNYTSGENDVEENLDYDYQIMKNKVSNQQYLEYLDDISESGDVIISATDVVGYYPGDAFYEAGNYIFFEFKEGDSDSRIFRTETGFTIVDGYEAHPVIEITWFGAWAFAQHYALRLPTEQEWEKAARGNTGYEYPWGNILSGERANYLNSGDDWDGFDGTSPVGYYNGDHVETTDSPSPFDVYDMCGNVFDWTDSWYDDSEYRVMRGGSWNKEISDDKLRSWFRTNGGYPVGNSNQIGFRCAVTP